MKPIPFSGYIWEKSDWPHFTWNSNGLLPAIERVSSLHGILTGRMALIGLHRRRQTLLSALTDELVSSSQIEGVVLNPDSVRSSIARKLGIEEGDLLAADHYVDGVVEVMMDALRMPGSQLSAERLFGWHAALFPTGRSGMHRIAVGRWREGDEPMQVVSGVMGSNRVHFQAPPSDSVEGMMSELISWCNSADISPFIKAAVAHLWFLTIHPFDDGNGRIARILADMILARVDADNSRYYSISAEINRNKKDYYDILERTQKGNLDITEWILWFLNGISGAIEAALTGIDSTIRKASFWDRFSGIEINERQRKIINRLWDGFEGKLTTAKYAKICHCSQDTALRDINRLVSLNILKPGTAHGRSTYYVLIG